MAEIAEHMSESRKTRQPDLAERYVHEDQDSSISIVSQRAGISG